MFQRNPAADGRGTSPTNGAPPIEERHGRAPAPAAAAAGGTRIELTTPIIGHRGTINEIVLREPTMGDYLDCGQVMITYGLAAGAAGDVERIQVVEDRVAIMRWMVALSGIEEALLRMMSVPDGIRVGRAIVSLAQASGN